MTVAPEGLGTSNLQPLGLAGQSTDLMLVPPEAKKEEKTPTSVSLYDQGLVPGAEIAVEAAHPEAGQFTVRLDGGERAVSEKAAAGLFVRPA